MELRAEAGTGAGEVNAATGSKEGLRDWTRRRKEEEETVVLAAASAGAVAMREVRPCGSESAAVGRGAGDAAALDAKETGFGFGLGLGLGLDFAAALALGLGRALGGGGGSGERRRGGEVETPEGRRDSLKSESASCGGEYIGGGAAERCSERVGWWTGRRQEGDLGEICGNFPPRSQVRSWLRKRLCCWKELAMYASERPSPSSCRAMKKRGFNLDRPFRLLVLRAVWIHLLNIS